jgi:hypothetical protein
MTEVMAIILSGGPANGQQLVIVRAFSFNLFMTNNVSCEMPHSGGPEYPPTHIAVYEITPWVRDGKYIFEFHGIREIGALV